MVQWLRICPTMQRTSVWSLSRKIPHDTKQLSQCATTTEPLLWSPRAETTETEVPWCPCTPKGEATTMRSLLTAVRETEQQRRPSTAKKKPPWLLSWEHSCSRESKLRNSKQLYGGFHTVRNWAASEELRPNNTHVGKLWRRSSIPSWI